MSNNPRFWLDPKTWTFLEDIGVSAEDALRSAGLPRDLLARGPAAVDDLAYFRLWKVIDESIDARSTAVAILEGLRAEMLSAPIFATMCAANLTGAAHRLAQFKPLICGSRLAVEEDNEGLTIRQDWSSCSTPPPELVWTELLLWIGLARLATQSVIVPVAMEGPVVAPASRQEIARYAGVVPTCRADMPDSKMVSIRFTRQVAGLPFLTTDHAMWEYFEPGLRTRLGELTRDSQTSDRVRSLLVELLPGGRGTIRAVAEEMAMSERTLQRRLNQESTTFQQVLVATRAELAERFLSDPDLPFAQVALLVGYEDPTSFHRAYREWTGNTPAGGRALALSSDALG